MSEKKIFSTITGHGWTTTEYGELLAKRNRELLEQIEAQAKEIEELKKENQKLDKEADRIDRERLKYTQQYKYWIKKYDEKCNSEYCPKGGKRK